MPALTQTFEFNNPYVTTNSYTTKPGITMPQMVNGVSPEPTLTFYSEKLKAAGYFGLGAGTHTVAYTISGGFIGTCTMQASITPNPSDTDWFDLTETKQYYVGLETTGGAGISGGFSGEVSHPMQTNSFLFTGTYAWVRARLDISRGTLQSIKFNF